MSGHHINDLILIAVGLVGLAVAGFDMNRVFFVSGLDRHRRRFQQSRLRSSIAFVCFMIGWIGVIDFAYFH